MQPISKPRISGRMSVNEVVRQFPATIPVFATSGIDTCCGGSLPVEEAARRHDIELRALLSALDTAAGTR